MGPGSGSTIFKGGSEDPDPDPQFSKGGSEDPDPDPLYQNVDPGIRIRIRIHVKIVWIRNPANFTFLNIKLPDGKLVTRLGLEGDGPVLGVAGLRAVAAQHRHVGRCHAQQTLEYI